MKNKVTPIAKHYMSSLVTTCLLIINIFLATSVDLSAQIDNNGCLAAGFGIDAGVYSNIIEFGDGTPGAGSRDWFFSSGSGIGTIDESNTAALTSLLMTPGNPNYEVRMAELFSSFIDGQLWIDGLYAREDFGGTGFIDQTSYATASKNGEDPAIWDPGISNVLGKNDLIDVAGHMFRDGNTLGSDLWFVGLINRAEPGGTAYMDFEFFVEDVGYNTGSGFTSGGADLGHTAFQFDGTGAITKIGDIIFNVALINGGETADIQTRLWVSKADYDAGNTPPGFSFGPEYDGAFNGSPFGYASIIPNTTDICGIVNISGQTLPAPPWGTRGTKSNIYETTYSEFSVAEIGINMTSLGIDHASLLGADPCFFPLNTFMVKTRASASFTAQLKDFAGPYAWGGDDIQTQIIGNPLLSCENPIVTLIADPPRMDATYEWNTNDGEIIGSNTGVSIMTAKPGTYTLSTTLSTSCPLEDVNSVVAFDPSKPFIGPITAVPMVACNDNDGAIDLTAVGGTPPLSFAWSNGAMTDDIFGLAPGTYSLTITDNIGCQDISTMVIVPARVPTMVSPSITDAACIGEPTGSIVLGVTGQSPFTYEWSTGDISKDLFNISAGSYNVTVTDADGCEEIVTGILVDEPTAISLAVSATDETDSALDNGTIDLTVSGGTPGSGYLYDWDNDITGDNDDTQDLMNLAAGTYNVIVTDGNGCTAKISATVFEPEICNDGIDNDGDGLSDCLDPDCTPITPGSITPSMPLVCVGNMGVTYTIVDVGEDTYNWAVPAGATIISGQGTVSITVNWVSKIGGAICVTSQTEGCLSPSSCITVEVNDVPAKPGVIIAN